MEIKFKVWIEKDGEHILGKGGAEILKAIKEHHSISKASKELGMSYRYVWGYIRRVERNLGERIVIRRRGGERGGKSTLTNLGEFILKLYEELENEIDKTVKKLGQRYLNKQK